ncbi:MAG: hypothetical protein WAW61_22480 [Methylococcaceae bacterium]
MKKYKPIIQKTGDGCFNSFVVRVYEDGYEVEMKGFNGFYKTSQDALEEANNFIKKLIKEF